MITEHAVCALPDDHRDWRHLVLRVKRRGNTDRWLVTWGAYWLTSDDQWSPSMADAWEFSENGARQVAEFHARLVDVNGLTAADLLARNP